MAVIEKTTFHVECPVPTCTFRKTFESSAEALERSKRHDRFHEQFGDGVAVMAPTSIGSHMESARVTVTWFNWEEVLVTFDRLVDCHECLHPHKKARTWRGKMERLEVKS